MGRKLFCEISPLCYKISHNKEIFKKNIKDLFSNEKIAKAKDENPFPYIIKSHTSIMLRKLNGVDMQLQKNKVTNIKLACKKINGIVINPNETFSYWKTLGRCTEKEGYKEGLTINKGKFNKGFGGGLCQMANMIHYLVLNSPLEVTELHHHSDALFPDDRRRVPFGTGTSVYYNAVDYRFKNTLDCPVQILVWVEDDVLCGELRCQKDIPYRYKLIEENHHFKKEKDDYYRISQIYKVNIDKKTNKEIKRELILDNHSKVMYNHSLIPKDEIRND